MVVCFDQLTKAWILSALPIGAEWPAGGPLTRWFAIHHIRNTGMAFGFGQGRGAMFLVIAILVAGMLLAWAASAPPHERLLRASLGLIAGGAIGNAIDRMRFGDVVDFFDFRFFPIFNVADSAISVGVVLLAWHAWRTEQLRAGAETAAPDG